MLCCIFLPRLRHTFATSYHLHTSYHIEYITSCDISQSVKLREGVKNCEKGVTLTERGAQGVTHTLLIGRGEQAKPSSNGFPSVGFENIITHFKNLK